jgi:YidC/Oxa1 family membrane protein insertase
MIAIAIWQSLLNGLGWCMAQVYDVIPNYALTIIVVTVVIRLLLLPFGFKQIKSMQHMQALQPKIKELQKKYKNNKQKQQEETMKLYKEAGVNPLGGCLPMLLTLPFLFAMYAVIRPPVLAPNADASGQTVSYTVINNHLPTDSTLFYNVVEHQDLEMLSVNLQCALATAGTTVTEKDSQKQPIQEGLPILASGNVPIASEPNSKATLDCGTSKFPDAIPYVVLLLLMLGTAIFQQRQMTKANPPSAQTGPNAAIMKYMPLLYGVWGFAFPAGLIVYWTTANGIQIGQQSLMLRAGHIGPEALERRMAEQRAKMAEGKPQRKGIMGWMNDKAAQAQNQQEAVRKPQSDTKRTGAAPAKGGPRKPTKGAAPGNQLKPTKSTSPGNRPKPKKQPEGGSDA